jgi:hypothetical protein
VFYLIECPIPKTSEHHPSQLVYVFPIQVEFQQFLVDSFIDSIHLLERNCLASPASIQTSKLYEGLDLRQVMRRILCSFAFPKCLVLPTNFTYGISKVCTIGPTLTSVTHQTNLVYTQTISTIKYATSFVMNSTMSYAITHPIQVIHFTTKYSLGLHKVCAQTNLPPHRQSNLFVSLMQNLR